MAHFGTMPHGNDAIMVMIRLLKKNVDRNFRKSVIWNFGPLYNIHEESVNKDYFAYICS